ncbi:MAG: peptidylprolyl isomerase [Acidobacteriota bacterium]
MKNVLLILMYITIAGYTWAQEPPSVLAEMEGYQLTEQDFNELLEMLPQKTREQVADPEAKTIFVKSWMQLMAFSAEAKSQDLDEDPEFQERLDFLRTQLLAEEIRTQISESAEVTEQEVEQHYLAHKEEYKRPAMIKVSHILVPTQAEADEIQKALTEGASFETLASEKSKDPVSGSRSGDLGWINPGRLVPEFEQVAFSLEPGATSPPVQTKFGWHLIRVAEKKPAGYTELEEVKAPITEQLLDQKRQELMEQKGEDLFKKYNVTIY